MFCPRCGTQNPDGSAFCSHCGTALTAPAGGVPAAAAPGAASGATAEAASACGVAPGTAPGAAGIAGPALSPVAPAGSPAPSVPVFNAAPGQASGQAPFGQPPVPYAAPALPMRWYKFLIWFSLFLGALVNFGAGIASLTGATYGDDAALVYAFYQGLKPVDVIYGVVLVLLAVATIAVRQELAHFKKDGPLHYLVLIGANIVIALVHLIALAAVTGLRIGDLADSSTWGSMFASAVLIVVNYLYFGKRKHLFCN